jgi:hypothetical protein
MVFGDLIFVKKVIARRGRRTDYPSLRHHLLSEAISLAGRPSLPLTFYFRGYLNKYSRGL